ncbi:MAG: succinate dehydrogenase cytochrome b subunit [Rikenellaceae bacterium]|jgi:succinate dehydrogenase / fumarate reductase cytochrome b subunit|nr:succinate dehydrogenase cytochrome b subunit [Rikenellaceae bacterium]
MKPPFIVSSSIGRKLVMSISGAFLVLFLTFHAVMNSVALISADAYNWICAVLGANWYAVIGTLVIAGGVVVHILYAVWLTWQNLRARGKQRYAVTKTEAGVSWSAKNMLVLGFVVLGGLCVHLIHFWSKMQLVELMGEHLNSLGIGPQDGAAMIAVTFSHWYNVVIYLVWFAAIWLHLTHGMWSMMQSTGWNNQKWIPRIQLIGNIWATVIMVLYAAVVVVFFVKSLI